MNRRVLARTVALVALATAFGNLPSAHADEYPEEGCTGNLVSITPGTHCCSLNECTGIGSLFWDHRENAYESWLYSTGCVQNHHTGSPGGCC